MNTGTDNSLADLIADTNRILLAEETNTITGRIPAQSSRSEVNIHSKSPVISNRIVVSNMKNGKYLNIFHNCMIFI